MEHAPIPPDEAERLRALAGLNLLDTPPEERFDRITRMALHVFRVPISTITLVDSHREWFKSCQGLPSTEGPRAISFCGHAMLADETFIIADAAKDGRFADNPMVVGPPFIRFYAGVPVMSVDGKRVGTFCIKDRKPRRLAAAKVSILKALGSWAELELNFHELGRALEAQRDAERKTLDVNRILKLLNVILRHDILNDLTVVKANLSLLAEHGGLAYLENSMAAIERGIELIEKMRDLEAAISAGKGLKPYRIRDVVAKVAASHADIRIGVEGDAAVMADEAILSVVDNIVRNAKIHGGADRVDIAVGGKDGEIEIAIANQGRNIPDEVKKHLFQEGYTYGGAGHTGLGLYIVRKTVERYGGTVRVENNSPHGAKFVISLPRPSATLVS